MEVFYKRSYTKESERMEIIFGLISSTWASGLKLFYPSDDDRLKFVLDVIATSPMDTKANEFPPLVTTIMEKIAKEPNSSVYQPYLNSNTS
jgi:hypothetical protein